MRHQDANVSQIAVDRRKYPRVVEPAGTEPPRRVQYGLEEALGLLAALEDCRDALLASDRLSVLAQAEHEIQVLSRKLGFEQGGPGGR